MDVQKAQQPSWLAQNTLVAVLWGSLWALSMLMSAAPYDSVWFPAAGITLVAMLLFGLRAAPGIAVAIIATTFLADLVFGGNGSVKSLLTDAGFFIVSHIGVFWLYAVLLRVSVHRYMLLESEDSPITLTIIFTFVVLLCVFTAAWMGIEVLTYTRMLSGEEQQTLFWSWAIGDIAGLMVVAPICLGIAGVGYPTVRTYLAGMSFQDHPVDKGPILTKASVALVTLIVVLSINTFSSNPGVAALVFVVLIPLLWIVLTESPAIAATTLGVLTLLMTLFVDSVGLIDNELIYQSAIIIMAITTWLIIALRTAAIRTEAIRIEAL